MAKDDKKKKTVEDYLNRQAKIIRSTELAYSPNYDKAFKAIQDKLVPPHMRAMKEFEAKYKRIFAPAPIFDAYKKFEVLTPSMVKTTYDINEIAAMSKYISLALTNFKFEIPDTSIFKLLNANSYEDLSWFEYDLDEAEEEDIEPEKKAEIILQAPSLIRSIYEDQNLLNDIHHRLFEEVIAELLYKKGFEVELTKQTRDGGRDIIALSTIGGSNFKILVECKRYKRTVGVDIIRSFCDVIHTEKANKGFIVTTSYFSRDAKARQAKEGTLLDLIDRTEVIQWVNDYCQKLY